jgi:hypothetical protein
MPFLIYFCLCGDNRAYGTVHKATHKESGFVVAVKIIPQVQNVAAQEDMKKEINILKKCSHDCIVQYFGCCFADDCLWVRCSFHLLCSPSPFAFWSCTGYSHTQPHRNADLDGLLWGGIGARPAQGPQTSHLGRKRGKRQCAPSRVFWLLVN